MLTRSIMRSMPAKQMMAVGCTGLAVALGSVLAMDPVMAGVAPGAMSASAAVAAAPSITLWTPGQVLNTQEVRLTGRTAGVGPATVVTVVLQRSVAGRWTTVVSKRQQSGPYAFTRRHPGGTYVYRTRLLVGTRVLGTSPTRTVRVLAPPSSPLNTLPPSAAS